jgi:hypothetical protein
MYLILNDLNFCLIGIFGFIIVFIKLSIIGFKRLKSYTNQQLNMNAKNGDLFSILQHCGVTVIFLIFGFGGFFFFLSEIVAIFLFQCIVFLVKCIMYLFKCITIFIVFFFKCIPLLIFIAIFFCILFE